MILSSCQHLFSITFLVLTGIFGKGKRGWLGSASRSALIQIGVSLYGERNPFLGWRISALMLMTKLIQDPLYQFNRMNRMQGRAYAFNRTVDQIELPEETINVIQGFQFRAYTLNQRIYMAIDLANKFLKTRRASERDRVSFVEGKLIEEGYITEIQDGNAKIRITNENTILTKPVTDLFVHASTRQDRFEPYTTDPTERKNIIQSFASLFDFLDHTGKEIPVITWRRDSPAPRDRIIGFRTNTSKYVRILIKGGEFESCPYKNMPNFLFTRKNTPQKRYFYSSPNRYHFICLGKDPEFKEWVTTLMLGRKYREGYFPGYLRLTGLYTDVELEKLDNIIDFISIPELSRKELLRAVYENKNDNSFFLSQIPWRGGVNRKQDPYKDLKNMFKEEGIPSQLCENPKAYSHRSPMITTAMNICVKGGGIPFSIGKTLFHHGKSIQPPILAFDFSQIKNKEVELSWVKWENPESIVYSPGTSDPLGAQSIKISLDDVLPLLTELIHDSVQESPKLPPIMITRKDIFNSNVLKYKNSGSKLRDLCKDLQLELVQYSSEGYLRMFRESPRGWSIAPGYSVVLNDARVSDSGVSYGMYTQTSILPRSEGGVRRTALPIIVTLWGAGPYNIKQILRMSCHLSAFNVLSAGAVRFPDPIRRATGIWRNKSPIS